MEATGRKSPVDFYYAQVTSSSFIVLVLSVFAQTTKIREFFRELRTHASSIVIKSVDV